MAYHHIDSKKEDHITTFTDLVNAILKQDTPLLLNLSEKDKMAIVQRTTRQELQCLLKQAESSSDVGVGGPNKKDIMDALTLILPSEGMHRLRSLLRGPSFYETAGGCQGLTVPPPPLSPQNNTGVPAKTRELTQQAEKLVKIVEQWRTDSESIYSFNQKDWEDLFAKTSTEDLAQAMERLNLTRGEKTSLFTMLEFSLGEKKVEAIFARFAKQQPPGSGPNVGVLNKEEEEIKDKIVHNPHEIVLRLTNLEEDSIMRIISALTPMEAIKIWNQLPPPLRITAGKRFPPNAISEFKGKIGQIQ